MASLVVGAKLFPGPHGEGYSTQHREEIQERGGTRSGFRRVKTGCEQ
jgi:hypothetical protein